MQHRNDVKKYDTDVELYKKGVVEHGNEPDLKSKPKTALVAHHAQNGHNFNFDNGRILQRNLSNNKKRKFVESLHIARDTDAINFKMDVEGIGGYRILV